MSDDQQDASIPQQNAWADAICEQEGIEIVRRFVDEGLKGHENRKRVEYHEMLDYYCRQQPARCSPQCR
jgi:hypothetical protein